MSNQRKRFCSLVFTNEISTSSTPINQPISARLSRGVVHNHSIPHNSQSASPYYIDNGYCNKVFEFFHTYLWCDEHWISLNTINHPIYA